MYSKEYLFELNPEQRAAVKSPLEHVVVTAGAGTGKTRVIVSRAVYLLSKARVNKPIVILTFTKKAAQEITERLDSLKDVNTTKIVVSTFHGWCWSIIKTAPFMREFSGYQLNDDADSKYLIEMAIKQAGVTIKGSKDTFIKQLKEILSYGRNTSKPLIEVIEFCSPELSGDIENIKLIRAEYGKILQSEKRLDFEGIINQVAIKVRKDANALSWLVQQYSTVLIDEAQDTNRLQWKILKPLSNHVPLFIVGDDAQAIYGFRGTTSNSMTHMTEQLDGVNTKELSLNYRSTQQILDLSNALVSLSTELEERNLNSNKGTGILPQVYTLLDKNDEMSFITNELQRIFDKNKTLEHVLVLVRTNLEIESLQLVLAEAGIPVNAPEKEQDQVIEVQKYITTILRLSTGHFSSINWHTYLSLFTGVGDKTITKVLPQLIKSNSIKKMKKGITNLGLNKPIFDKLFTALNFILKVKKLRGVPENAIQMVIEEFRPQLRNKASQDWSHCERVFQKLIYSSITYSCIDSYLDSITLDPESHHIDKNKGVSIITVHRAKGIEARTCFIINVSPGNYPRYRAIKTKKIEEELRIFYVALTRAKNKLVITSRLSAHSKPDNSANKRKDRYFLSQLHKKLYVTK